MIRSPVRRTQIAAVGFVAAAAAVVAAAFRHARARHPERTVPGGMLVSNVVSYDGMSGLLFGSLFRGIAADVASVAQNDPRVLEVGCGPGHLSISMARRHALDVTAIDLDPAMIERAHANADRDQGGDASGPSFLVGDVAALPFADALFDVVVSTFSMHHWADPTAGLAEISRVLRPGGKLLIWDFRPGSRPHVLGRRHDHIPDPAEHAQGLPLRVVSSTPLRWPWRFSLAQRIELVRT